MNLGGQGAFFGTINSFVHVIMYSYYLLTIINPEYKKAWWKKYLTVIQLVSGNAHLTLNLISKHKPKYWFFLVVFLFCFVSTHCSVRFFF